MSTPEELDALAKAMASSKPWLVGLSLSWAAYGGTLVQLGTLFWGNRSPDSPWRKAVLCLIFAVATLDAGMNLRSMILTLTTHFGDLVYLNTYTPDNGTIMMPFIELAVLWMCQVFLIHRCLAFARSFYGHLRWYRYAIFATLALLASASFALGAISQAITWEIGSLVTIQAEASDGGVATFHILEAGWLSTSLAVDIGLTLTITYDLHRAMSFGANDVGVGANVRQIMRQLFALASVNGIVLVVFQLSFLVVIMIDNAGWTDGALIFLPQLQLLSVLTLVNLPRTTRRVQDSDHYHSSTGNTPDCILPSPTSSRPPLTPLERGRRKLNPLVGKWGRGGRQMKTGPGASPPAHRKAETTSDPWSSVPSGGRALGLQEMLAASPTASFLNQR